MIQLVFESKGKITLDAQGRLVFRLSPTRVECGDSLHQQAQQAGLNAPQDEAMGALALQYDGEAARHAQVILELPDEVWDNLANWTDDLLDQELMPEEWADEEDGDEDF